MLVISNGNPKSATSLFCSYTLDMLKVDPANSPAMQMLKEGLDSGDFKGSDHFVEILDTACLEKLYQISKTYGTLVVKAHHPPSPDLLAFLEKPGVFMTYGYRDPRDVLLSAIDHQTLFPDEKKAGLLKSQQIKEIIPDVQSWCRICLEWQRYSQVYFYEYTQLLTDPFQALSDLQAYFNLSFSAQEINQMLQKETDARQLGQNRFNKGLLKRYPNEMSPETLSFCNRFLYRELKGLHFPIEQEWRIKLDIMLQKLKQS